MTFTSTSAGTPLQRLLNWGNGRRGQIFTAAEAASACAVALRATETLLLTLRRNGEVHRVRGTGQKGVPGQYSFGPAEPSAGIPTTAERLLAWAEEQTPGRPAPFCALDVAIALNVSETNALMALRRLTRIGTLRQVGGTGRKGNPVVYAVVPAAQRPLPGFGPDGKPLPPEPGRSASKKPPKGTPPTRRALSGRLKRLIDQKPELTLKELAGLLGVTEEFTDTLFSELPSRVRRRTPLRPTAPIRSLPPVPPFLKRDERHLYDVLRREEHGLEPRVLGARLNWTTQARVDRMLEQLEDQGLVRRTGARYQVQAEEQAQTEEQAQATGQTTAA